MVSDFSLIDAIESGIVKVPRVPVSDNTMNGEQPTYRDLWLRIRDELPKKGRGDRGSRPASRSCRSALEGALAKPLRQLQEVPRRWAAERRSSRQRADAAGVHRRLQQHQRLASWSSTTSPAGKRPLPMARTVAVPGDCRCSAMSKDGQCTSRPNTILVDSEQLESGEAMSDDFKKIAATEIEEFKAEYRTRFPGRDPDKLTDEDILREVCNTVGKPGKLGENIKCVVSASPC